MSLITDLTDFVNAAFSGIWVQTYEPDEAEREICQHAASQSWKTVVWDVARGLRFAGDAPAATPESGAGDPLTALRALPALADPQGTALLLLHNFHRFLNNAEVMQTVFGQLIAGKQQRTFIVVLSPVVQIPVELEKLFVVVEHPLPDRLQLANLVQDLTSDHPEEKPEGKALESVLDAASGLTRYEAEGSFALSLARHNALRPDSIWELKAQTLKKNAFLTLHRGKETFSSLGGLHSLKDFCQRALASRGNVRPRGILLLGVPGTGKSQFARALGNETGRPTLVLDVGALYGSLVGTTEANIRQAIRIVDATGKCVLFCDEVEKALGGIGGQGDSGVSTRLFGTLLTWLADHESDVFTVFSANDISRLPPEFSRAERFDGIFFLDLPGSAEKDQIWKMYRTLYAISDAQVRPGDTDWTGAEIRSCCRLAALLDVPLTQAALHVVPVAVTAAESVQKLRSWASGRCLSASAPGVYSLPGTTPVKTPRRVNRGPSSN